MNTEEKAKAYDEAIERAKKVLLDCTSEEQKVVEYITPELADSEDEKTGKEIINYFHCQSEEEPTRREIHNKWIAWLEKQGEHYNFRQKIQVGDQVTRNEDGVLVNLSQLKRVAKQGEQKTVEKNRGNNGGISPNIEGVKKIEEPNIEQEESSIDIQAMCSKYRELFNENDFVSGITDFALYHYKMGLIDMMNKLKKEE